MLNNARELSLSLCSLQDELDRRLSASISYDLGPSLQGARLGAGSADRLGSQEIVVVVKRDGFSPIILLRSLF